MVLEERLIVFYIFFPSVKTQKDDIFLFFLFCIFFTDNQSNAINTINTINIIRQSAMQCNRIQHAMLTRLQLFNLIDGFRYDRQPNRGATT